jgi:cytochrome c oxidase assembly protein subunit 15
VKSITAYLQARLRPLAWATLVANIAIVVTGGVVRLTGSGLGCPTWPRCTDDAFTPHQALTIHSAIEFGNRMLTYVLVAIAIATVIAAWRTSQRSLALWIAAGIPAQAVIGGITVLTDLNPWIVSFHLLVSMAIISLSVLLLWRVHDQPAGTNEAPVAKLGWATYVVAWLVLYAGTVVTGAGPHAGDADAPRNGLSTLELSQLHADLVCVFIGLTLGLLLFTWRTAARPAVLTLFLIECAQGGIGWVQYFTKVPAVLVGFHMLGAALVTAAVTWVLLKVRTTR